MKSYKQMYEDAKKSKDVKQLTPVYQEWKAKGDIIVGVFVSKGTVQSSSGGEPYYQYVFETDEGNVKFHLGRAADTDVGVVLKPGVIYAIEYLGKDDISGGRRVNKFNVEEIGPTGDFTPEITPTE